MRICKCINYKNGISIINDCEIHNNHECKSYIIVHNAKDIGAIKIVTKTNEKIYSRNYTHGTPRSLWLDDNTIEIHDSLIKYDDIVDIVAYYYKQICTFSN